MESTSQFVNLESTKTQRKFYLSILFIYRIPSEHRSIMNTVAIFLFVIGLVGFAPVHGLIIAGPITHPLQFFGYTTGIGGTTTGADQTIFGDYNYTTSTIPQNQLIHNSYFTNLATGTLQHYCIFDWNGVLTDVHITHIPTTSLNATARLVNMRGIYIYSGTDNAGFDYEITSVYPNTEIKNNVMASGAATHISFHMNPSNAYSVVGFETRSIL